MHRNGATGQFYMPEMMGAGVALFDYDNDGDLDVFLVQGGPLDGAVAGRTSRYPTSRLFRNDLTSARTASRTLHFTDVTERAGVGAARLRHGRRRRRLRQRRRPRSVRHGVRAGHAVSQQRRRHVHRRHARRPASAIHCWSTSAAFVDYDRDGELDLFVANYLDFTLAGNKTCYDPVGARDYCGPRAYRPVPDACTATTATAASPT